MKVKQTDDTLLAIAVRTELQKNGGYCPCQLQKTEDTKCFCKDFIENVKPGKKCICELYIKLSD